VGMNPRRDPPSDQTCLLQSRQKTKKNRKRSVFSLISEKKEPALRTKAGSIARIT
jgi:hypothetical protein